MCYLSNSHHLEFHPVITETWSPVPIRVTQHQPLIHTQCQKHLPQTHSSPITHSISSSLHPLISSQTCTQRKCSSWRKLLLNTIFHFLQAIPPLSKTSTFSTDVFVCFEMAALQRRSVWGKKVFAEENWLEVVTCVCVKRVCNLLLWPSYSLGNKKK